MLGVLEDDHEQACALPSKRSERRRRANRTRSVHEPDTRCACGWETRVRGFFELRAIHRAERRFQSRTEFSEDELAPIHVTHMSLTHLGDLNRRQFDDLLKDYGTVFLTDARQDIYAMITPVLFEYLLQVSKVLNDDRSFQLTHEGRTEIEAELQQAE